MPASQAPTVRLVCPGCQRPTDNLNTTPTGAHHRISTYGPNGSVVWHDVPVLLSRCDELDCPGHFHLGPIPTV